MLFDDPTARDKQHMMPCHHPLAEALHAYIATAGIAADKKAFLFRTSRGHGGTGLGHQPMTQVDACAENRVPTSGPFNGAF
jgi:hypothetical protein